MVDGSALDAPHRVLAVDDNLYELELLAEAFRHGAVRGVQLERLNSVAQMRESLARGACPGPKLVLLDLQMPGEDGFAGLQWLRAQHADWRRVPVIMMTSGHNYADIRRAYDLGANSFLVKPTGFEELRREVDDLARYWLSRNRYA